MPQAGLPCTRGLDRIDPNHDCNTDCECDRRYRRYSFNYNDLGYERPQNVFSGHHRDIAAWMDRQVGPEEAGRVLDVGRPYSPVHPSEHYSRGYQGQYADERSYSRSSSNRNAASLRPQIRDRDQDRNRGRSPPARHRGRADHEDDHMERLQRELDAMYLTQARPSAPRNTGHDYDDYQPRAEAPNSRSRTGYAEPSYQQRQPRHMLEEAPPSSRGRRMDFGAETDREGRAVRNTERVRRR